MNDNADNNYNLEQLAGLIEKYAPHDGRFKLAIDGVHVTRMSTITDISTHSLALPGICIVAQGAKQVFLAEQAYEYDESNLIVYAAEVPVTTRITKANKDAPFLCLVIQLDPQKLTGAIHKVFPNGVPKVAETQAIYIGKNNNQILNPAIRLMQIILAQDDADLLAPLMIEEILIRLLRSPSGVAIAQIAVTDSHAQKVAKAIVWLKENYNQTMKVGELADIAGMSASSFHNHFKNITAMSPLQFQKTIRLHEARNLITQQMTDVTQAGYAVGYASVSQFSREYSREFGVSPSKDIYQNTLMITEH
ncbi:MAG: AraC family transcriptional regulator N-terminal domain-containing protein [Alphaproteobacteria bacterium]